MKSKLTAEQIRKKMHNIDDELWDLTRLLTSHMIPYCPYPNEKSLAMIKHNNPRGYKILMRYKRLDRQMDKLEKQLESMGEDRWDG